MTTIHPEDNLTQDVATLIQASADVTDEQALRLAQAILLHVGPKIAGYTMESLGDRVLPTVREALA